MPLPTHPALLAAAALLLTLSAAAAERASTVLGSCSGKAGAQKETQEATFALKAESAIKLSYAISGNPADATPEVVVRIQRKLPNKSFVTIKTLADLSGAGQTESKSYPAGDYRLEVTAANANFKVTAEKD